MHDETFVRFTADHVPRDDLQALMTRSNGPALWRAVWHFGVLAVTGALLWRLRGSLWALPVLVAHAYVLVFVFCAFHETAHRTAFRTRWLNTLVGSLAGFLTFWRIGTIACTTGSTTVTRRIRREIPSCTFRSRPREPPISWCSPGSRTRSVVWATSFGSPRASPTGRGWLRRSAVLS